MNQTQEGSVLFETALLPGGWAADVRVNWRGGVIDRIETGAARAATDQLRPIGLPGMPNLHSHAFQRGMAGLAEVGGPAADSFWTWREVMYRFLAELTPDDCEALAALAYVEMLESGFTRVAEFHYLHHAPDGTPYANVAEMADRIAAAASETGIGLTLLPVFYGHGGFGGQPASPAQRRFVTDLDRFAKLHEASRRAIAPLAYGRIGIAPHSLRAVTGEQLSALVAAHPVGPIHIHVAEQVREVDDCMAWSGKRPVKWLLETGLVDDRWCLIHATHMTPDETTGVAASGAIAGLCPITEANLGDGTFEFPAFQQAGGRWGVGSDSNVLIDAAGELRQLEYSQRLALRARNVAAGRIGASTGRALFDAAVTGGAIATGRAHTGLAVGAPADMIALDAAAIELGRRGGDRIIDAWLFGSRRSLVTDSWCAGRHVVSNGEHKARDGIERRASRVLDRLASG